MVYTGENGGSGMRPQEELRIPYSAGAEEDYIWLPLRGEASFLFPPVRRCEGELIYYIEGLTPLPQCVRKDSEPEELCRMLQRIVAVRPLLDSFLIRENHISWDPAQLYWHAPRQEVLFLYLPDGGERVEMDFWREYAALLLERAIEERWTNEALLLFLLRFNQWSRHPKEEGVGLPWSPVDPGRTEKLVHDSILAERMPERSPKRKKSFPFLPRR